MDRAVGTKTRLCHAAAVGLLGFYLMTPPVTETGMGIVINGNLSLSLWDRQGAFDTKEDCEKHRVQLKEDNPEPTGPWHRGDAMRNLQGEALRNGRCFATDDPRLKEK
ncbi:MAG: hypothetical protein ACREQR_07710 [Candidatus Binataceae bacterium]